MIKHMKPFARCTGVWNWEVSNGGSIQAFCEEIIVLQGGNIGLHSAGSVLSRIFLKD